MLHLPDPSLPWPISMAAVALAAEKEQGPGGGVALKSYRCPAGVWTIGWGETDGVRPGMVWTKAYADQRFCDGLTERAIGVRALCKVAPTEGELGALVLLAYNIGMTGLAKSTVMRLHNAGDKAGAARAFALWNKVRNPATGKLEESRGLTIRRAQEAAIYLTPETGAHVEPAPMPQAVEPESNLAKSPINVTAAVPIVGGAMSLLSTLSDQVNGAVTKLNELAASMQMDPAVVLSVVAIGAGCIVIYNRRKQRRGGWA